ncbi:MAG: hypothetical protein M3Z01_03490 [Thermoproteota archaeon]|nr:hypothetical protein [Thermoproteota archaeon]
MLTQRPKKRKTISKKVVQILVDKQQQHQQEGFTIISLDESFYFYNSLIRVGLD